MGRIVPISVNNEVLQMASKCGEACEVYSRVTGYFRPISAWNRGKAEEARDRVMFKVPGKDK